MPDLDQSVTRQVVLFSLEDSNAIVDLLNDPLFRLTEELVEGLVPMECLSWLEEVTEWSHGICH
jgi:hypothetical protein